MTWTLKSKNSEKSALRVLAGAALTVLLSAACSALRPLPNSMPEEAGRLASYSGLKGVENDLPKSPSSNLPLELAKSGFLDLAKGDLAAANKHFNRALMFKPVDSHLQWLNGVTYHLRAIQGEYSQFEMAREAYFLAIQFDPTNWMTHYQLGLQDIPILQYFFSAETTLDFQKSVLLLITPRQPVTLTPGGHEAQQKPANGSQPALLQLQNRYDAWFTPAPHWVSVVQHLEESGLYREFRSDDLELEIWAESQAFRRRFGDVLEFPYYY